MISGKRYKLTNTVEAILTSVEDRGRLNGQHVC